MNNYIKKLWRHLVDVSGVIQGIAFLSTLSFAAYFLNVWSWLKAIALETIIKQPREWHAGVWVIVGTLSLISFIFFFILGRYFEIRKLFKPTPKHFHFHLYRGFTFRYDSADGYVDYAPYCPEDKITLENRHSRFRDEMVYVCTQCNLKISTSVHEYETIRKTFIKLVEAYIGGVRTDLPTE